MTTTALASIKDINRLKREIKDVERRLNGVRNNIDYNSLNERLAALHISMKIEAESLVSSLTTTIELSTF